MIRRSTRILFIIASIVIIVMAFLVSVARLFFPYFEEYRVDIERWASEELKRPVVIKEVIADWGGLQPRMRIKGVSVYVPDGSRVWVRFKEVQIYFNVFSSLSEWRLRPGKINIVGADVDVERKDGSYYIGGIRVETEVNLGKSRLLNWMLAREKLVVTRGKITWKDPRVSSKKQILKDVNVLLSFREKNYHFSGSFRHKHKGNNKFYFIVNLLGSFKDLKNMQRKFFFSGNAKLGKWLNKKLLSNINIKDGDIDFRLWGEGTGKVEKLYGDLDIDDLKWRRVGTALSGFSRTRRYKPFSLDKLSANFLWLNRNKGWSINVNNIKVSRADRWWPKSRIYLQYENELEGKKNLQTVTGSIKFVRLEDLGQLLLSVLPIDNELRTRLATYRPKGDIKKLEFDLQKKADTPLKYYFSFDFDQLGINKLLKSIKFSGLSGHVKANTLGGYLSLRTKKSIVEFAKAFEKPLALTKASGILNWKHTEDKTVLNADKIIVNSKYGKSSTRLNLVFRKNKPVFSDISTVFNDVDLNHIFVYLPIKIMKPKIVKWLKGAISKGRITAGSATYQGYLDGKLFNTGHNLLKVKFSTVGAGLRYEEDWPAIYDIESDVLFYGKYMRVKMNAGKVFGMELMPTTITIPSLNARATVALQGNMIGPTSDVLRFLAAIPSKAKKNSFLSHFKSKGNAVLNLNLVLPLSKLSKRSFIGHIEFMESELKHTGWKAKLSAVNGILRYESDGHFIKLHSSNIKAKYKGKPVAIHISTDKTNAGSRFDTYVSLEAKMKFSKLLGSFSGFFHGIIKGVSKWKVGFKIRQFRHAAPKVSISIASDLRGSSVRLPEGFAKRKKGKRSFLLEADITGKKLGVVKLDYGNFLSSSLMIEKRANGQHKLKKGEIRFGGERAILPDANELRITGKLKSFSLSRWLAWAEKRGQLKNQGEQIMDSIDYLDLTFDKLEIVGNHLQNISLRARKRARHWHASVKGKEIEGELQIPLFVNDRDPINVKLKKLVLVSSEEEDEKEHREVPDPRKLPPIRITSEKFYYNGSYYGRLNITASRVKEGLEFGDFSMVADDLKIIANGTWKYSTGLHSSHFDIVVEAKDLGAALARRKYSASLKGGKAKAVIQAFWRGPPTWYKLKRVNGNMTVSVSKGRVLDVKPGGGKMLGIFSLQALPRRLSLDFSDIFKKGLAFDRITARFNITNGDAYTHDFKMVGPAVKVKIKGRIGLADQDYDQTIYVTPKLTANIPVIGGLAAASPQVGIGLWVANQIMGKKINRMSTSEYSLQGTWEKPILTKKRKRRRLYKPEDDINWADKSE